MRIAMQTILIVLCCLLGGLSLYSAVWIEFTRVEELRDKEQQSQLAMRDIHHLETMLNQWFVTIDLFFSQQQSYLAPGVSRQAQQLTESLNELDAIAPHESPEIQKHIDAISVIVAAASLQDPTDTGLWNMRLARADSESATIVELMDSLYSYFETYHDEQAQSLQAAEEALMPKLASYAGGYFALVLLVWLWATRTLVSPLQKLHKQAMRPLEEQQAEPFDLKHGPWEILRLGNSLNHYSHRLQEALRHAEEEKENADRARARTDSIMNAAPDAIVSLSTSGDLTHINHTTHDMFGLTSDAAGQTHIGELIPQFLDNSLQLDTHHSQEVIGKNTGGRKFPLEISAAPLDQQDGGYTLVMRDITARKLQELKVKKLNQKLVAASRQAGIAEIATGILHNVGNVLNSITTSVALLQSAQTQSSALKVRKVADMLQNHSDDLPGLFSPGNKGAQLPEFLDSLCERIDDELANQKSELTGLSKNIDHVAEIVASQQKFAGQASVTEPLNLAEVLNDALAMHSADLKKMGIRVIKDYGPLNIMSDRHNLMQIFVNLIRNSGEAIAEQKPATGALRIRVTEVANQQLKIDITDNGSGLDEEQKQNLFRHGFTTKTGGHGFGLHSCALAAKNMQGVLTASSQGRGKGCTFTLQLPASPMENAA